SLSAFLSTASAPPPFQLLFFFTAPATTDIYTLSLHDALPILRPTSMPREPRAALIAWEQIGLLRHLVYLIPPSALAASRVVPLDEGVVVLTGSTIGARTPASAAGLGAGAIVPLGRRLGEVAPGVLVPDGHELWPRVRPALMRQLLGLGPDDHAIF